MSRSVPTRALDASYDPVYTVSHSGGRFSKGVYRAGSGASVPVSTNNQHTAIEGYAMVSGPERAKFFRRPVLPHLLAEPPEVLLAPVAVPSAIKKRLQDEDAVAPTRSVGVQTMYRDSDAQTDPYTPDYTIKKSATRATPEVLSLLHLRHGKGLPAGQAEVELIERARKKKAFEASLPPMTDEASFLLRKAMLEAQETREWAYREAEIDQLHAQRIALLQHALQERDRENAFLAEQRVDTLRQKLVHETENALERIQQERVTALRKLTKKRQHGHLTSPRRDLTRDIIGEYADFSSRVYAPATRAGKTGKVDVLELGIGKAQYQEIESLRELESAVPARMLVSSKLKPPERSVRTAKERKQAAVEAHLLKMESIIKKNKEAAAEGGASPTGGGGAAAAPAGERTSPIARRRSQAQSQAAMRPPTPEYAAASEEDESVADAMRLLQKLLRGRAVQNMMFEGKERRAELILELRASDEAAQRAAHSTTSNRLAGDEHARVASATLARAEGEVVSEMLDVLYKELDRAKEVAKMREFVEAAAAQRRTREVEEGGRRQAEELLREREDEVFRHLERVHQETAADFIQDIVRGVIQEAAHATALDELNVMTHAVGGIVTQLEAELNSDETVVKELVASLLFPQVQRRHVRDQVAQEQKKYVTAAHSVLTKAVARMKTS
ncbi:hypothetical protein PybrP1_005818 [[Pythium] brassicae (nom. inval.)]|nr:hypothetical protein PybrP1_005818 [[Pythium] brassicae (nom. inval.)]